MQHDDAPLMNGMIEIEPAPMRIVLGSQALQTTPSTLRKCIADFSAQTEVAASTDFPPGE